MTSIVRCGASARLRPVAVMSTDLSLHSQTTIHNQAIMQSQLDNSQDYAMYIERRHGAKMSLDNLLCGHLYSSANSFFHDNLF